MKLTTVKASVPVLMMMLFGSGYGNTPFEMNDVNRFVYLSWHK